MAQRTADLIADCLEAEGVDRVYGVPGEETIDLNDALAASDVTFVPTRHEQGAAYVADVEGRITQDPGVCLATLGPGATNLVTAVADAHLDHAPLVAIAGQAGTERMHKESHQHVDLVGLFEPVTKTSRTIRRPDAAAETVRKAFRTARTEKKGAAFVELPEDVARAKTDETPMPVRDPTPGVPDPATVREAADRVAGADRPILLVGNGVARGGASAAEALRELARDAQIPVATTFMGKGAFPDDDPLSLHTIGLQSGDVVNTGFDDADLVLAVGYDLIEYDPRHWNPEGDKTVVHVDSVPAETTRHYAPEVELTGSIEAGLSSLAGELSATKDPSFATELRDRIVDELHGEEAMDGFPPTPQRIVHDVRERLDRDDVVVSDVGAHKLWIARLYDCYAPHTCIISNGLAGMGIGLPGAIGAKLARPDRDVVAMVGDGGLLMNVQEMETATRLGVDPIVVVWRDDGYGLIDWHMTKAFGSAEGLGVDFTNPDLGGLADAFGWAGYEVAEEDDLGRHLDAALADDRPALIDCPVDYAENMKLTERLGEIICRS